MKGYKVRLADGSEIGSMDLEAVRNWYAQGLLETTSPVLKPGAKHWAPLSEVIELVDLRTPRRSGGGADFDDDDDTRFAGGPVSYVWPMRVAGVLAFVAAAGAAFFWWFPRRFTPAIDPVPWREIALALFATGLLLARGWGWGRRLGQLVLLLATAALPVLAGILVVEGVRGRPLLAMLAAFVFTAGTFALLTVWPSRWYKPTAAALVAAAGLAGIGHFGLAQETPLQRQVFEWAGPETSISNDGVSLALPESWRVLKAGQTAVAAPAGAKAVLGEARLGGLGYVVVEDAPRGVTSLDQYFERTLARRRQELAGLTELGRREIRVGSLRGRALDGAWSGGGGRFRELMAAWRSGGTYVALLAWVQDDGSTRPAAQLEALVRGLSLDGSREERHARAVEAAARDVPLLSPAAADLVVTGAPLPLAPDVAFARTFALSNAGDSALTADEVRDKVLLLATAVATVGPRERPQVLAYVDRLRLGEAANEGDASAAGWLRSALLQLSSPQLARLQELHERAIRAAASRT
jgi:hypothetical protein